jgi:hypothetical protein
MHASCAAAAHRIVYRIAAATVSSSNEPVAAGSSSGSASHQLLVYCPQHHCAIYDISTALEAGQREASTSAEAYAVKRLAMSSVPTLHHSSGMASKRTRGQADLPSDIAVELVSSYWISIREQRMRSSADMVAKINAGQLDVLAALMRPEIMKVEPKKVLLARFLCLTPEIHLFTALMIEGVVPVGSSSDEGRRNTRRSGNTENLFGTMIRAQEQIQHVASLCQKITTRVEVQDELHQLDVKELDLQLAAALGRHKRSSQGS